MTAVDESPWAPGLHNVEASSAPGKVRSRTRGRGLPRSVLQQRHQALCCTEGPLERAGGGSPPVRRTLLLCLLGNPAASGAGLWGSGGLRRWKKPKNVDNSNQETNKPPQRDQEGFHGDRIPQERRRDPEHGKAGWLCPGAPPPCPGPSAPSPAPGAGRAPESG